MNSFDNSYYEVISRLKYFADGHYLINTFSQGQEAQLDTSKSTDFPLMHVVPTNMVRTTGSKVYTFDVIFADLPRMKEDKVENQKEVLSDTDRMADDLVNEIRAGNTVFGRGVDIVGDATTEPFMEEYSNVLTGVVLRLSLSVPYTWNACDVPAQWNTNDPTQPEFGSRELTLDVYDEQTFVVAARSMDFRGSGVTVTYEGNRAIVTITGGGGGGGLTCEDLADCDTIKTIEESVTAAIATANTYTDNQINALTYSDVGADAAGAAASALSSANSYTNTEIAALTKADVGLGNVDNTSDLNKPISTATQTALDLKADITQLPLIYKSTTDSAAVTGTTTVTKLRSQLIPANTFAVGDIIRIRWRDRKTGTAGNATHSLYVHTSDSVTGASLLGFFTQTATRLSFQGKRDLVIKSSTVTEVADNGTSLVTDDADIQTAFDNINIEWTVDQYLIFAVNPANAGDTMRNSSYIIERL